MAKRGTRVEAERIARELANPIGEVEISGEYAVEYTSVYGQREQWRVIHITEILDGTPDVHPGTESMIKSSQGQLHDYDSPWW